MFVRSIVGSSILLNCNLRMQWTSMKLSKRIFFQHGTRFTVNRNELTHRLISSYLYWYSTYHLPCLGFYMWPLRFSLKIGIVWRENQWDSMRQDRSGQDRTKLMRTKGHEHHWNEKDYGRINVPCCTKVRPYAHNNRHKQPEKMARHLNCFGLFFGQRSQTSRKKIPTREYSICPKVCTKGTLYAEFICRIKFAWNQFFIE